MLLRPFLFNMASLWLALMTLLVCEKASADGDSRCVAQTTCRSEDLVPHITDCHTYFSCDNPSVPLTCPSHAPYFDGKACNSDRTMCCTVAATPLKPFIQKSQCPDICESGIPKIRYPTDCRLYYDCTLPDIPLYCPLDYLYFDGNNCQTEVEECCAPIPTTTTALPTAPPTAAPPTATPPTAAPPTAAPPTAAPPTTAPPTAAQTTATPPTAAPPPTTTTAPPSSYPMDCLPIPDCSLLPPGSQLPNPKDCTQFFICFPDGTLSTDSYPCPENESFHPVILECVSNPSGVDIPCFPACCPLTCKESDRLIHPHDCQKYYFCYGELTDIVECQGSSSPYFNGETCVGDEDSCCPIPCKTYCSVLVSLLPHPTDCHKYYNCTEYGPPDPASAMTCEPGEIFDYRLSRCSTDALCEPICP
ncbi:hypothetical protein Pcinc_022100 [Petrolisthes cinctipes]|uniref:Chitin-binding type-2 domain-containing protein n=1 Tax=Petrolisthes cinctipes TaxID=88211 RepID=A0AAE1KIW6_PETCI|nr:hypothetical protein Pcinc_022100 [Petrolisthes cinctipes]